MARPSPCEDPVTIATGLGEASRGRGEERVELNKTMVGLRRWQISGIWRGRRSRWETEPRCKSSDGSLYERRRIRNTHLQEQVPHGIGKLRSCGIHGRSTLIEDRPMYKNCGWWVIYRASTSEFALIEQCADLSDERKTRLALE